VNNYSLHDFTIVVLQLDLAVLRRNKSTAHNAFHSYEFRRINSDYYLFIFYDYYSYVHYNDAIIIIA
jgi:hypothetical protein